MRNFKLTLILGLVLILMAFVSSAEAKTEIYNWKMISGESENQQATVFSETFAKKVEERSDGRIKIKVYPYGTFGSTVNILELVQMGEVELCAIDTSWLANLVSQMSIFNLQYLWPKREDINEVVANYIIRNGQSIQLLNEASRDKGLQLLGLYPAGWQTISSNVSIHSPEDCKGLKHRVWGNPILVSAYNAFGFNSQSLNWTEVYGALQTKIIDSQYQPIYSHWDNSFYEVTTYITNLWNEIFMMSPTINRDIFDSLSKDLQQVLNDSFLDTTKSGSPFMDWLFQSEKEAVEKIKEAKPTMTIYELSDEEIVPFKELARQDKNTLSAYFRVGGKGSEDVYNALITDIEAVQKQ